MKSDSSLTRRQFISTAAAATAAAALPAKTFAAPAAAALDPDWANAGIIATRNSPYAKLKSVPVRAVTIDTGFWSKRRQTNVDSSIPSMRLELLEHGRMDNFLRLEGKSTAPQRGPVYSDSDIYKWVEAVGFALQSGPLPEVAPANRGDDSPGGRRAGTQRIPEHLLRREQTERSHAAQDADRRTRALLHRPPAAGRHRVVSRDRRSNAVERRPALCR